MTAPRQSAIVVALPEASSPLYGMLVETDDSGPLHCTIRYYGKPDPASLPGLVELLTHLGETVGPFEADVSGRGRLGKDDAAVLFLDSAACQDFHDLLDGAVSDDGDKFPSYTPHVSLGYGTDVDIESMTRDDFPTTIVFDRIALWNGDDRMEFPLTGAEEMADADESSQFTPDTDGKDLMLAAAEVVVDAELGVVVAGGVSIPPIDSIDDLQAAIDFADVNPSARWYVEQRAHALAADAALPWIDAVVASGGPTIGEDADLVDAIAADVHHAWIEAKQAEGVESRLSADGREQMVPYADLDDDLQELDRVTVRAVLASPALQTYLSGEDDPDDDVPLAGPGGVQAAAAYYVRARSLGHTPDPSVYDEMIADAAAEGMSDDPVVLSAVAWHERDDAP